MPRLRQRCRAEVRAPRHPHQQCRHPQIREGRRGECGELERDPQRQPDELRLLVGPSDAFRRKLDFYRAMLARLAALKPTTLARMHGAWNGDCAKLLMALAATL